MSNIFISYQRKEAESFAYLLYKDLTNDGYINKVRWCSNQWAMGRKCSTYSII